MQGQSKKPASVWYIDSGCSRHMTGNNTLLHDFKSINGGYVAFGSKGGRISGKGTVSNGILSFNQVNYVDNLDYNLLSVSQICDNKYSTLFDDSACYVLKPGFTIPKEWILLTAPRVKDVYLLDMNSESSLSVESCLISKASDSDSILWHRRMGHVNFNNMNALVKNENVFGLPNKLFANTDLCVACQKGKQHKSSHKIKKINTIDTPLQLLHMDLFGPVNTLSIGRKAYCLVITDDFSHFTWVFFLKLKSETADIIKCHILKIENLSNHKVKTIRCDNGTEFRNTNLDSFCENKGIYRQYSAARTPQQNGVAERRNRTLIEAARTMLADSQLPVTFWAEAVNTACYVQNRVLIVKSKSKTPYELYVGRKPNINFLKPFGCQCTILKQKDYLGKFDTKSDDGYFVGYSSVSMAYRVFNRRTRLIEESPNVSFLERTENQPGTGPRWLFDLDSLVNSFNLSIADYVSEDFSGNIDVDFSVDNSEDDMIIRTVDPPCYVQPPPVVSEEPSALSQGESSTIRERESHHETADPSHDILATDPISDDIPTDHVSQEELVISTAPELNQSNMESVINEEPVAQSRLQSYHPVENILGDLSQGVLTRNQTGLINTCLHACFLSQMEPKNAIEALKDSSWIEAMQEELQQFYNLDVW